MARSEFSTDVRERLHLAHLVMVEWVVDVIEGNGVRTLGPFLCEADAVEAYQPIVTQWQGQGGDLTRTGRTVLWQHGTRIAGVITVRQHITA